MKHKSNTIKKKHKKHKKQNYTRVKKKKHKNKTLHKKKIIKKHRHKSTEKAGFRVNLSRIQLNQLYEVRNEHDNTSCGACSMNILGLDLKKIYLLNEKKRQGTYGANPDNVLKIINDYVKDIWYHREREITHLRRGIGRPGKDPAPTVSWVESRQIKVNRYFNKNVLEFIYRHVKPGQITILGIPGHWCVIGRTYNQGKPIIIESQADDDEDEEYFSCDCAAGLYIGDSQVLEYIKDSYLEAAKNEGENPKTYDFEPLIIPNYVFTIEEAEPEFQELRYGTPDGYISTGSMEYDDESEDYDDEAEDYEESDHDEGKRLHDYLQRRAAIGRTVAPAVKQLSAPAPAPAFGSSTGSALVFGRATAPAPAFGSSTGPALVFGRATAPAPAFGSSTGPALVFGSSAAPAFRRPTAFM